MSKLYLILILVNSFLPCLGKDKIQFKNKQHELNYCYEKDNNGQCAHAIPTQRHAFIAYWEKYIGFRKTADWILGSVMFIEDDPCKMYLWLNRQSTDAGMIQEVVGPYTETEIAKALVDQAIMHARISQCIQLRINVHESQKYRIDTREGIFKPNENRPGWYEWIYELS